MNLTAFHWKFIIWLTVRPTWVAISGTEKPLSAGKSYAIECTTSGSRPSANIHWYLHSIQQQAAKERVRCRPVHFSSTFSQSFQFKFQKIITGGFPCRWRWTDATRRAHWSWFRRPRITTPNWSAPPSIRQWLRRRIATSAEVTTREIIWPQGFCHRRRRRRRSKLDENLSSIVRRTNELIFVLFFLVFLLFLFLSFLCGLPTHFLSSQTTLSLMKTKTSTTAMMRFSIMGYDVDGVVGPYWEMAREFFSFSRVGYKKIKVPFFHLHSSAKGKEKSNPATPEDGKRTKRTFLFFFFFVLCGDYASHLVC